MSTARGYAAAWLRLPSSGPSRRWAGAGAVPGAGRRLERVSGPIDASTSEPLGVCIGVTELGWLGLFSLHVTPSARRRGVATQLVDALSSWSAASGATATYLQVEADNPAALSFYATRGFHIAHSYHYRSA